MKKMTLMAFMIGVCFAAFGAPRASAVTCEQKCANAYAACLAAGQSQAICQNDRGECLHDCL